MQHAGELAIPTLNGTPYLSKPPLIYWVQIGLAEVLGQRVELVHLRAAVAIAGVLGVMLTWLACRRLLASEASAVWAGVLLASGILYVRSSRVGELDIYLVPGVVLCGWMAFEGVMLRAGAGVLRRGVIVMLGCLGAVIAGLAKGPPGLAMCAVVTIGACLVWAGQSRGLRVSGSDGREWGGRDAKAETWVRTASWILAIALAGVSVWISGRQAESLGDWFGVGLFAMLAMVIGHQLGRLSQPGRLLAALWLAWRSGGVVMVIVGQLAFAAWGYVVTQRLGPEVWGRFAKEEAGDNLHVLMPESPLVNLEAMAYGAGLGSIAAIGVLIWLWQVGTRGAVRVSEVLDGGSLQDEALARRRLGLVWLVVWVIGGLCVFSFAGKGVARYLTPLWPGLAMLGGFGLAMLIRREMHGERGRLGIGVIAAAIVAGLSIGQVIHYAQRSDRDPGPLIKELQTRYSVKGSEIFTMEFRTPALDYYAQQTVYGFGNLQIRPAIAGFEPIGLEKIAEVAGRQRVVLLVRDIKTNEQPSGTPIERLQRMGLQVTTLAVEARFEIDSGRARVLAVEVGEGKRRGVSDER